LRSSSRSQSAYTMQEALSRFGRKQAQSQAGPGQQARLATPERGPAQSVDSLNDSEDNSPADSDGPDIRELCLYHVKWRTPCNLEKYPYGWRCTPAAACRNVRFKQRGSPVAAPEEIGPAAGRLRSRTPSPPSRPADDDAVSPISPVGRDHGA